MENNIWKTQNNWHNSTSRIYISVDNCRFQKNKSQIDPTIFSIHFILTFRLIAFEWDFDDMFELEMTFHCRIYNKYRWFSFKIVQVYHETCESNFCSIESVCKVFLCTNFIGSALRCYKYHKKNYRKLICRNKGIVSSKTKSLNIGYHISNNVTIMMQKFSINCVLTLETVSYISTLDKKSL